MPDIFTMLASFTAPMEIPTTPTSMLWMFPLLASISIIYKATKMRVLFVKHFIREVIILFITVSLFMIVAATILITIVQFIT